MRGGVGGGNLNRVLHTLHTRPRGSGEGSEDCHRRRHFRERPNDRRAHLANKCGRWPTFPPCSFVLFLRRLPCGERGAGTGPRLGATTSAASPDDDKDNLDPGPCAMCDLRGVGSTLVAACRHFPQRARRSSCYCSHNSSVPASLGRWTHRGGAPELPRLALTTSTASV
eukprot:scaffold1618_cov397-Prasinococcus_capsulatus_cf.AAC.25